MHFLSELLHGFPCNKIKFIIIEGKEGKTTTAKLLQHILSHLNISSSIYSKKYSLSTFAKNQLKQNVKYIISEYPLPILNPIIAKIDLSKNPDKIASKIKISANKLSFDYDKTEFITDSPYYYLVNTLVCVYGICKKIGVKNPDFVESIKYFPDINGKREEIPNNFKFRTFIDSAQAPLSINAILVSMTKIPHNKLTVIFGHSSLKDKSMRSEIGDLLQKYADKIFFTADDTVRETINDIAKDVFGDNLNKVEIIANRQDAFDTAVKTATTDDIIIALGIGRRNYIIQNHTRFPWSEAEAFRTAFRNKNL